MASYTIRFRPFLRGHALLQVPCSEIGNSPIRQYRPIVTASPFGVNFLNSMQLQQYGQVVISRYSYFSRKDSVRFSLSVIARSSVSPNIPAIFKQSSLGRLLSSSVSMNCLLSIFVFVSVVHTREAMTHGGWGFLSHAAFPSDRLIITNNRIIL